LLGELKHILAEAFNSNAHARTRPASSVRIFIFEPEF